MLQDPEYGQTRVTAARASADRLSFTSASSPTRVRLPLLCESPSLVSRTPGRNRSQHGSCAHGYCLQEDSQTGPASLTPNIKFPGRLSMVQLGPVTSRTSRRARSQGHTVPNSGSQGTPVGGGRCVSARTCVCARMLGLRKN